MRGRTATAGESFLSGKVASFFIAVYDGFVIQTLLDPQRVPDGRRLTAALTAVVTLPR